VRMDRKMMGGEDCASGLPGSCGAVKRVTWTENLRAARHICMDGTTARCGGLAAH